MKSTIHEYQKSNIKSMSKKLLLSIAVVAILFTACNEKKTNEHESDHSDETHQHADGQEHANHEDETVNQEEFTVTTDSVTTEVEHNHEHKNGEKHQH